MKPHVKNIPHLGLIISLLLFAGAWPAASQTPGRGDETLSPEQKVEKAIQMMLEIDELHLRDAERFEKLKEPDRLIREAVLVKPDMDRILLAQGLFASITNRSAEAIRALGLYNATPSARDDYRGFAKVGEIYLRSGMPRQAKHPLMRARDLAPIPSGKKDQPIKARIAMDLADVYLGLSQAKKAIETATEGQTFAPDHGEIQLRLAEITSRAQAFETAATAVKRAISILWIDIRDDPFQMAAHINLRRAYTISTDVHEYFLSTDPENGNHFADFAAMQLEKADVERRISLLDAWDLMTKAIEKSPGNTAWKLDLIRIEMELGGLSEARGHIADLLRADRKNADALKLKQRLDGPPCDHHPAMSPHYHF